MGNNPRGIRSSHHHHLVKDDHIRVFLIDDKESPVTTRGKQYHSGRCNDPGGIIRQQYSFGSPTM